MPDTLRIGLAGVGRHGLRYAMHLLADDVPRARLVAIHRRDAEAGREWAEARQIRFHDSLEALAADPAVDALVSVMPPALHPQAVAAAAAAGKPILVEKPLGNSLEAAQQALETARAAGIVAMVSQTMRFSAVVRALRDLVPSLGPLHLVAINNRFEPADRRWFNDPVHGGMVVNTGCHGIDLLRFLTGAEVADVQAFSRRIVTSDVDDVFAAIVRMEPGPVLATLDNTWATGGRMGRIEIVGERGMLQADTVHHTLAEIRGRRMTTLPCPAPVPTVREVLRAFVRAVLDGVPPPVTLEDGLAAVAGAEQIKAAFNSGSPR